MAEQLRVVIDPNVLVTAAIADGAPRRIVELVAAGGIRMVTCPRLHNELEGVLARERFLRWRTREQLDQRVADIRVLAHRLPDPTDVPAVSRDPNDDHLIALFRAVDADVLCSGDDHLAAVDGFEVLSPRNLLDRLVPPSPPASSAASAGPGPRTDCVGRRKLVLRPASSAAGSTCRAGPRPWGRRAAS